MVQQSGLLPWPHPCFVFFKLDLVPPGRGFPHGLLIPFWMDFNLDKLMALVFPMDISLPHGLVPLVRPHMD